MKLPSWRGARAKITTSADLAAEVDQHRRLLGEATAALATLDAARRDVLLGDDVAAIRDHETRAAELRLGVARLEVRLDALSDQATEIATAEAATALDVRRTAAEARASEGVAWLREVYPELAHALCDGLQSLHEAEREVIAVNDDLAKVGLDQVSGIQARLAVFIGGNGLDSGSALVAGSATSLGGAIRLPELVGGLQAPGWTPRPWS